MSSTRRPTASVVTLGCKVNQYESEAMAEALTDAGFSVTSAPDGSCDVCVINTCTVTSEADRKSRQLIRRLCGQSNGQNPSSAPFIIVTGCSAQADASAVAAIPGVDAVIGNRQKLRVVEVAVRLVESGVKPSEPLVEVPSLHGCSFEAMNITHFDRTRAYVKIQDGCESHCTYCAIPRSRGPLRSKPLPDVIGEVERLVRSGCREVVLTGIETGSWGVDLPDGRFADLLSCVDRVPGLCRMRLGSLDPAVITPAFVDRISGLSTLAPHFHLSMQSGCSATLARMKRRYNASQAEKALNLLRQAIPGVQFTTDMIVGFPGETEEEFAESLDFARRAQFLHIHVFPYSRRENTPAASMPGQIPKSVRHDRVVALSAVSDESCAGILDSILHAPDPKPLSVLFENRNGPFMYGHTAEFIEVQVKTDCALHGKELPVHPVSRDGNILTAVL